MGFYCNLDAACRQFPGNPSPRDLMKALEWWASTHGSGSVVDLAANWGCNTALELVTLLRDHFAVRRNQHDAFFGNATDGEIGDLFNRLNRSNQALATTTLHIQRMKEVIMERATEIGCQTFRQLWRMMEGHLEARGARTMSSVEAIGSLVALQNMDHSKGWLCQ